MIFRMQYGKIGMFDRCTINVLCPYQTYSRRRSLPDNTILWDLYIRYALEDVEGVPKNVKKECIAFTTYRSFYYNRVRYWQPGIPNRYFVEKGVACYD